MSNKRTILETWYRRVWDEQDASAIHELLVPDGAIKDLADRDLVGPDEFEAFQQSILTLVDNPGVTVDKFFEDGDWASVLFTFHFSPKGSGERMTISSQAMVRFDGDKIAEAHNHVDFLEFFEKIGQLPEASFARGLSGEKIAV